MVRIASCQCASWFAYRAGNSVGSVADRCAAFDSISSQKRSLDHTTSARSATWKWCPPTQRARRRASGPANDGASSSCAYSMRSSSSFSSMSCLFVAPSGHRRSSPGITSRVNSCSLLTYRAMQ